MSAPATPVPARVAARAAGRAGSSDAVRARIPCRGAASPLAMPAHEQGQALALGMLLMAVVTLAWAGSAAVGRVAGARTRLAHVADATAYSGALAHARSLNLLSYINRAQIAHQVALAHLATVGAWNQFASAQARQAGMRNPPPSLIGGLFGLSVGWAFGRARPGPVSLASLRAAVHWHDQAVHQVLQQAARAQWQATPELRAQLMQAVLRANSDGTVPPALHLIFDGWPQAVVERGATAPDGLRPWALAAAGHYSLLYPRDHTRPSDWLVYAWCPWLRHELRRRGATRLGADGRWQAADTLSFHSLRFSRWRGCYHREYPMGWARVHAGGLLATGDRVMPPALAEYAWRLYEIGRHGGGFDGANPQASWRALAQAWHLPGQGLPAVHASGAHPWPAIAIRLRSAIGQADSARAGTATEALAWRLVWPGLDTAFVVREAAAEAYFVAPPGLGAAPPSGRGERASQEPEPFTLLLRPYWQARRIDEAAFSGGGSAHSASLGPGEVRR